jgi:hypothetical protein
MTRTISDLLASGRFEGAIVPRKPKTHFEQVPLEIVKKLTKRTTGKKTTKRLGQPSSRGTGR